MLETSNSEINVDRLMHEIRETVARQQPGAGENVAASLGRYPLDGKSASRAQLDLSPLNLQPEFHPRPDNQYHVNDLLKYHGRDFVRNAYRAILRREPDEAGLSHHLENLASGRFNKIDILASLRHSPEGERAQVKIAGLAWPARVRRLERAPIIGYLIQIAIGVGRLPILLRHQRQYEFYHSAQQQQIVDHQNQAYRELSAYSDQLAETLAQTIANVETDAHRLQDLTKQQLELRDVIENRIAAARQILMQQLKAQAKQLQQTQTELSTLEEQTRAEWIRLEEQARQLLRQQEQQTRSELLRLEEQMQQLLRRHQQTQTELLMQERRLTLLLEKAREPSTEAASQQRLQTAMTGEEDHLLDSLYAAFEDQFRGDREEIKNRLRVYLPILKDAEVTGDVLDIGCGRGEWLELLGDEGVRSQGVDHNRVFVEQCRQRGLDVAEEDAIVYLRSLPDSSLNAITSFHLVEHLPFETLIKLLDEIIRTLKPGGLLILETPNPQNLIVGSYSFYADPTHRNPIPSPTLQFLLESRGLSDIKVMNLRPWDDARIEGETEIIKRFNEYFYSSPDYGIVGWKV